ncbi:putative basic fgf-repressed zic binding protein homolog (zic3-binding protein) [Schistosoma mansoni]|uniref:Putative basic fgf-repressed zic binding protein homolog (Zic3-binding protein) n=2 Tax=Schistosoma mansoni TaxID=6183 RepID=G4VF91_SCHMA|nr:putative basic fgf-repressed zic binding protein homolog (zic3-binding protein) [Schistosoma mansoni]|eukprot:XP_018651209.1 putative basic fgf-repressed zic binding protein homolog (zic3-binding protein) [Schistosoma mansoni]
MNLQRLWIFNLWRNVNHMSSRYSHPHKLNFIPSTALTKTKYFFGLTGKLQYPNRTLRISGENLFIICAEYPVFEDFVQHLKLPDTFQTWFSLTILHIWMCYVRLRQEGEEGHIVKKWMDRALWEDMGHRVRAFKILTKSSKQIRVFRGQYFGNMVGYDEALLSCSDSHLAGALWSNIWFSCPTTAFQQIEILIKYVRKQLEHLEKTPSNVFLESGAPMFLPLMQDELDASLAKQRLRYCLTFPEHYK